MIHALPHRRGSAACDGNAAKGIWAPRHGRWRHWDGHRKDPQIAQYAKAQGLCLMTGDWGFGDIRAYPPADYHGIVVVGVPDAASPADILDVVRTLVDQPTLVALLSGRLAIVERHKIRLRPPPP